MVHGYVVTSHLFIHRPPLITLIIKNSSYSPLLCPFATELSRVKEWPFVDPLAFHGLETTETAVVVDICASTGKAPSRDYPLLLSRFVAAIAWDMESWESTRSTPLIWPFLCAAAAALASTRAGNMARHFFFHLLAARPRRVSHALARNQQPPIHFNWAALKRPFLGIFQKSKISLFPL